MCIRHKNDIFCFLVLSIISFLSIVYTNNLKGVPPPESSNDDEIELAIMPEAEYIEYKETEDLSVEYVSIGTFKLTHYCGCKKCCGKWSSGSESDASGALGTKLTPYVSIAVDKRKIELGTVLYDADGNKYIAEDTGSAIKGNKIDLFVGNHNEALKLGVKEIELFEIVGQSN